MIEEFMPYIVTLLALAILVYKLWQDGRPLDASDVLGTLEKSQSEAGELAEVSLVAVQAAEQLWRSGAITRDDRWHEAVAYVKRFYPNLDAEVLAKNLESAVFIVNSMVSALPKKENSE